MSRTTPTFRGKFRSTAFALLTLLSSASVVHAAEPSQDPLFLTDPVRPIMMLNMSNDHQLFFKLYDDYSDLTNTTGGAPDGIPDTTYVHDYDYYGYFDSGKCYTYDTTANRFEPERFADNDKYCNTEGSDEWSGNFLNWATMTRIDAVRKILYGGMRVPGEAGDTADLTVLERAFLPQDAHSFAKYYNDTDIDKLTPFGSSDSVTMGADDKDSGITICNTTEPSDRSNLSQNDTGAPLMRVARGNFSLWASNERWQCRWGVQTNHNDSTASDIPAYNSSPQNSGDNNRRLGGRDFIVRVKVCDSDHMDTANSEGCLSYAGKLKPAGLLQEYGENELIHFGLMTGSYAANKSGGVLRKNVGNISDEINSDGTFKRPSTETEVASFNGIIRTLDLLRIYGYRFSDGTYHSATGSDGCLWTLSSFEDGTCSNWGNPQSEIFLESLRYLSGQTATSTFNVSDTNYISGLNNATWSAPVNNDNYCAPLGVIQFNASTSSYDGDSLDAADINLASVSVATNAVGAAEGIHGSSYFVGSVGGGNDDELCTAKAVGTLASVRGTCPDAPRLEGSYQIAGLAYHARKDGIPLKNVTQGTGKQTVRTYGVALAPAVPKVVVPVPNVDSSVTILPACRNINLADGKLDEPANCAIVDFKIVEQNFTDDKNSGKLYVNWEDSEQGGDFDQDMWGIIEYEVTTASVTVTTQVIAQSTPDPMGFGYVISGTTDDGFHVHSGVNRFTYGESCKEEESLYCTCRKPESDTGGACDADEAVARDKVFSIGTGTAEALEQPLYYAAKWGGYLEDDTEAADIASSNADTYFFATDPRELEASLRSAFASVAESVGSASAVATNSTRLVEGSRLYQARFNSKNWSGELISFAVDAAGDMTESSISTNSTMHSGVLSAASRTIYTNNGGRVEFLWDVLNAEQKAALSVNTAELSETDAATLGMNRLLWLRGGNISGMRTREAVDGNTLLLGDIVNSSPAYLGGTDMRYDRLPDTDASSSYRTYLATKRAATPRVFVGANDGMLHAFNASTLEEQFAYIPKGVYPKLARLTEPTYGRSTNPHQYLVDGPIAVGDAYLDGSWRSVVVGTLGAGGKGVYALDVTNPASPTVLFDITDSDHASIGYITGQAYIVPLLKDGGVRWAAVFGNGYESGSTGLIWIDLDTGDVNEIQVAATGGGLSGPALRPDPKGVVTAAYAGDMDGNLWKFDLSSTSSGSWTGTKMFTAIAGGEAQPITATPTLGVNPLRDHGVMVYFGTGSYLYPNDHSVDVPVQSFYALLDTGSELSRAALHQKVIATALDGSRIIANNAVYWRDADTDGDSVNDVEGVDGWFMNFPSNERVTTKPLLLYDRLVFATLIPSSVPCEYGGTSWTMDVSAIGRNEDSILGEMAANRFLVLGELGFSLIDIPPPPDPEPDPDEPECEGDECEGETEEETDDGSGCEQGEIPARIYAVASNGDLLAENGCLPSTALGRMSWRQIR